MAISDFANLLAGTFEITSPATVDYNCIAWAVYDTNRWWWPDPDDGFWPSTVPMERTLDAFVKAYETKDFVRCNVDDEGSLEDGFEKIAIYSNSEGPTHAARQLADGTWTSKLGSAEDIMHRELEGVGGPRGYGQVVCFMKRPHTPGE
jgi:hypothetical protein